MQLGLDVGWPDPDAPARDPDARDLAFPFVGMFAVSPVDGRAWRVVEAWANQDGRGWQRTAGPDGEPGPTLPTSCGHQGPRARPPGWK